MHVFLYAKYCLNFICTNFYTKKKINSNSNREKSISRKKYILSFINLNKAKVVIINFLRTNITNIQLVVFQSLAVTFKMKNLLFKNISQYIIHLKSNTTADVDIFIRFIIFLTNVVSFSIIFIYLD